MKFADYACEVQQNIHEAGYYVDVDDSTRTLNKKVREAQLAQYNFILVVGAQEVESKSVNVRTRDTEVLGTMLIGAFLEKVKQMTLNYE